MDNKGFIVEQTVMAANKNIEEVKAVIEGKQRYRISLEYCKTPSDVV